MPVITAAIDPVTRIEGHMKVDVKVDTVQGVQQVVDRPREPPAPD